MNKLKIILAALILILCFSLFAGCDISGFFNVRPFSEEAFLDLIEEGVQEQKTEISYTCSSEEDLDDLVESALDHAYERYLIGVNLKNINWRIFSIFNSTVIMELEYEDVFQDQRSSAEDYSYEILIKNIEDAIVEQAETPEFLFKKEDFIDEETLAKDVEKCFTSGDSGIAIYYSESYGYMVNVYEGYAHVRLDITYREDTVPFEKIPVFTELRSAAESMAVQWDEGKTAILYCPKETGQDPEELCLILLNTAISIDADDPFVCEGSQWWVSGKNDAIICIEKDYEGYAPEKLAAEREELLTEAQNIADSLTGETSEEKVMELGKILADRIEYDDDLSARIIDEKELANEDNIRRSAYGALIMGKTVCTGYAKAFKLICDLAGLDCWVMNGEVDGEGHEWNAVYIGGKMYYVDVTFADTGKMNDFYLFEDMLYNKQGYETEEMLYVPAA